MWSSRWKPAGTSVQHAVISFHKYTANAFMFAWLSSNMAHLFCAKSVKLISGLHVWARVTFPISKSNTSSTVCVTRDRVVCTISKRHTHTKKNCYIDLFAAAYLNTKYLKVLLLLWQVFQRGEGRSALQVCCSKTWNKWALGLFLRAEESYGENKVPWKGSNQTETTSSDGTASHWTAAHALTLRKRIHYIQRLKWRALKFYSCLAAYCSRSHLLAY